jgi:CheY-like chemotaxis protein
MSEEVLLRALEPYFTTKGPGEGTGLGLAAVHGIVTDHGGAVAIASRPGHGTTVSVYLPRAQGEAPQPDARPSPTPGRGERVLAVDDEVELLALTTDMLAAGGYRVTPHPDPQAAVAVLERDPAAFDALVTDQSMPGLTGIELAARARAVRPDLAVLLVTGYGHALGDEDTVAASVDAVLSKPYSAEDLLRALDQALTAARTRRPG